MPQKRDLTEDIMSHLKKYDPINDVNDSMKIQGLDNLRHAINAGKSQTRKYLNELIQDGQIKESTIKGKLHWDILEPDFTKPKEIIGMYTESLVNLNKKIDYILKKMGKKSIYKKIKTLTIYIPALTINRKTGKEIQTKQKTTHIEIETNLEQFKLFKKFVNHINQIIDNTTSILYVQVLSDYKKFTKEIESLIQDLLIASRNSVRAHITILLKKQNKNGKRAVERYLETHIRGFDNMMRIQRSFTLKDFTHEYDWNHLQEWKKNAKRSKISKMK